MKVTVNEGWQLGVDGKLVQAGETLDVPTELAEEWINAGQATAVKKAPKVEAKAVLSSKNKAVNPPEVESKADTK